jgi:hypothetical protein
VDPIDEVPEVLRELDPQHGPDAWVSLEEGPQGQSSVNLSWWARGGFSWGLIFGKPDLEPRSGLPGMEFQKLRPGAFAYSYGPGTAKGTYGEQALKRLVGRLDPSTLDQLQAWANAYVPDFSYPSVVVQAPEFMRRLDPEHGDPYIGSDIEAGVRVGVFLAWAKGAEDRWGLILRTGTGKPESIWEEIQEIRPGVFGFCSKHSSPDIQEQSPRGPLQQ